MRLILVALIVAITLASAKDASAQKKKKVVFPKTGINIGNVMAKQAQKPAKNATKKGVLLNPLDANFHVTGQCAAAFGFALYNPSAPCALQVQQCTSDAGCQAGLEYFVKRGEVSFGLWSNYFGCALLQCAFLNTAVEDDCEILSCVTTTPEGSQLALDWGKWFWSHDTRNSHPHEFEPHIGYHSTHSRVGWCQDLLYDYNPASGNFYVFPDREDDHITLGENRTYTCFVPRDRQLVFPLTVSTCIEGCAGAPTFPPNFDSCNEEEANGNQCGGYGQDEWLDGCSNVASAVDGYWAPYGQNPQWDQYTQEGNWTNLQLWYIIYIDGTVQNTVEAGAYGYHSTSGAFEVTVDPLFGEAQFGDLTCSGSHYVSVTGQFMELPALPLGNSYSVARVVTYDCNQELYNETCYEKIVQLQFHTYRFCSPACIEWGCPDEDGTPRCIDPQETNFANYAEGGSVLSKRSSEHEPTGTHLKAQLASPQRMHNARVVRGRLARPVRVTQ